MGHEDDRRHRRRLLRRPAGRPGACWSAIIDTGIDGTHPDIAPNFNAALSRNFTTDIPVDRRPVRGRRRCVDPANVDDDGHGTHVAGTIAAPINGIGIAGVAPNVTLVNLRAGQDSGLLLPPADGRRADLRRRHRRRRRQHELLHRPVAVQLRRQPGRLAAQEQAEQRTIIDGDAARARLRAQPRRHAGRRGGQRAHRTSTQRDHRRRPAPTSRPAPSSPRNVDNSCLDMPTEGHDVHRRLGGRPEQGEGRLLELRPRADRRRRARRLLPRLLRHAAVPRRREPDPRGLPEERGDRQRRPRTRTATPNTPLVVRDCQGGDVRATTSTSRAPRWRRRTPSAWPR